VTKFCLTGMILISFFAFCGHPDMSEGAAGPRLVLQDPGFDVGEVMQGKVIEHTFTLLNEGDETLEIKRVRPG
jgi:hypothetical protein